MEETQFRPVNTLLIDNYDSYTYNLYQYLAAVNGGTHLPCMLHTGKVYAYSVQLN